MYILTLSNMGCILGCPKDPVLPTLMYMQDLNERWLNGPNSLYNYLYSFLSRLMSCKCSCLWCVSTPPLWCQLLMSKVASRLYSKWCPHTHNWSGSKPSNCWDSFYHALHTSKFISLSLFDHIYSQIIVIWHTTVFVLGYFCPKIIFMQKAVDIG